ncbi:MAG: Do family serine endopeptidase [Alphaproteobacteria bacterium]|nr:Do family serine endopeptidase [Alphaproteobacteria bacterium]
MRTLLSILLICFALTGPATAQTRVVPESREDVMLSFAPVVKKAAPAVVNIYTKTTVSTRRSPFAGDPFFERFFGRDFGFGVPQQRQEQSLGSGVIVRSNGVIVTNNHVIDGADEITVILADRREFPARLTYADPRTDLAILEIDTRGEDLPTLTLRDSDTIEVGDIVLAIGNPFGVGQTVTSGIVSALARTRVGITDFSFFIQTDAAINPGNSGGALVTLDGKLIGINTAIYSRDRKGGSIGIGFAVPTNMVDTVISAALSGESARPWFGAAGKSVTSDIADAVGLSRPSGVIIEDVYESSPAHRAGLRPGDVVVGIDGREVPDLQSLRYRLATGKPGDLAELEVIRRGRLTRLELPLEIAPEVPPRNITRLGNISPLAGLTVANMSPAFNEEIGMPSNKRGVIVLDVDRGSSAARVGFRAQDIVLEVAGREIDSVDTLRRTIQRNRSDWPIVVERNGERRSTVVSR